MSFVIEDGVPLPLKREKKDGLTGVLRVMQIGQSVLVPFKQPNASSMARAVGRRVGFKFATRVEGPGSTRIWRIE